MLSENLINQEDKNITQQLEESNQNQNKKHNANKGGKRGWHLDLLQRSSKLGQIGVIALIGGLLIHLVLGSFYFWGAFSPYAVSFFRQNYDPNLLLTAGAIAFPLHSTFVGISIHFGLPMAKKIGFQQTVAICGIITFLGIFLASYVHNFYFFIVLIIIPPAIANGLSYMLPLFVCARYFPNSKGLVSGLILGFYGIGGFLCSNYIQILVNPTNILPIQIGNDKFFPPEVTKSVPSAVRFYACMCLLCLFLAAWFLKNKPDVASGSDQRRCNSRFLQVNTMLRQTLPNLVKRMLGIRKKNAVSDAPQAQFMDALVQDQIDTDEDELLDDLIQDIEPVQQQKENTDSSKVNQSIQNKTNNQINESSSPSSSPQDSQKEEIEQRLRGSFLGQNNDQQSIRKYTNSLIQYNKVHPQCNSISEGLYSDQFLCIFLLYACGTAYGFMIASNYKMVGMQMSSEYTDAFLTRMGSIAFLLNGMSRILWGLFFDKKGVKVVYSCILALQLLSVILAVWFFDTKPLFGLILIAAAVADAGMYSVGPPMAITIFGMEFGAQIYAYIFCAMIASNYGQFFIILFLKNAIGYTYVFSLFGGFNLIAFAMVWLLNTKFVPKTQVNLLNKVVRQLSALTSFTVGRKYDYSLQLQKKDQQSVKSIFDNSQL